MEILPLILPKAAEWVSEPRNNWSFSRYLPGGGLDVKISGNYSS